MQTNKTTTEMLDEFYRNLEEKDDLIEEEKSEANSEGKLNSLEILLNDYEKQMEDKGKEADVNERKEEESLHNPLKLLTKRTSVKQVIQAVKEEEDASDSQLQRAVNICLASKRVIELLHVLTEKERDNVILKMFTRLNPVETGDYEDCLFILAEYLTKQAHKMQVMFKLLQYSVEKGTYTLYPIFSLGLRKLSKSNKLEDAVILLNYMVYYKVEISNCAVNSFIEALCKQDKVEEAQNYFSKFQEYQPVYLFPQDILDKCKFSKLIMSSGINVVTYGTLIKCLCKTNNMDLALYHYENLKEQNLIKDEVIFNLLIDGCSKTSNLDRLKHIYYDMLFMKVTPTIVTFNTIIDAYIRAKDVNSAWQIYEDIISKGVKPDNFTYSTLFRGIRHKSHKEFLKKSFAILESLSEGEKGESVDIILINVLLDSCISMREEKLIVELFEKVKNNHFKNLKPDIITYNTFIKGCAQMNLYDKANEAFDYMFNQSEVHPNDVTFNTMIDVCVRRQDMAQVLSFVEKMRNVGIRPDNFTYSTIIKGLNKNSNLNFDDGELTQDGVNSANAILPSDNPPSELELAFKLFENVKKFSKPDEILYNCIMDACLRFDRTDKMLELYDEMLVENIKPSSITCGIIIKAYGMKGMVDKALEIYEDMKRENIEISSITYGCLINACIKNDNLTKAFELYEELEANKIEMNTVLYTTLIKAYSKKKDLNKVFDIFNKMKRDKSNLPNNVTYNSVIDCCVKCGEFKLAENILNEMTISGIKPDIISFSTLIKGCLKNSQLSQAIDNLSKMQKFNIKPDEVLLNSLLDGCEKMRSYQKAVEIFQYIRGFGVEPSMMSFSIMMKIYGKLNDFPSSKALMDEAKKKMKNISLIIFTCFMKTCFSTGNVEEAMKTYNQLKSYRLTPDSITFSTMLQGLTSKKEAKLEDIVTVLKDSLALNIMVNEKFYYDVVRILSADDKNSQTLKEVSELFKESGISVDLNSRHQLKGDGNLNYLINNYKHKKLGGKSGKKHSGTGNGNVNGNSHYQNKKDRVNLETPTYSEGKKAVLEQINPNPRPYNNSGYKGFSNVSTGSNYNHFYMKNTPSEANKTNLTSNLHLEDSWPRFTNSKREVGLHGDPVSSNSSSQFTSYNSSWKSDKTNLNQTTKPKKFNRF